MKTSKNASRKIESFTNNKITEILEYISKLSYLYSDNTDLIRTAIRLYIPLDTAKIIIKELSYSNSINDCMDLVKNILTREILDLAEKYAEKNIKIKDIDKSIDILFNPK